MTKQRREGEANGPQGQRPARVSRRGPSWTEFVRLAPQAVVAFAGAEMINRAEPRACGHSRGSRRLDPEPETERTAGPASNAAGDGCERVQDDQAGFQPYWLCGQVSYVAQLQKTPDLAADRAHWAPHNNTSLLGSRSTIRGAYACRAQERSHTMGRIEQHTNPANTGSNRPSRVSTAWVRQPSGLG